MLNKENKDLCWKVLAKYGVKHQQNMVIEECAELQKAICKLFRDNGKRQSKHQINYVEELVDVIVMCEQMVLAEQITEDMINRLAKIKLERALENGENTNSANH